MANLAVESPKERYARYERARGKADNWRSVLQDAYDYAAPIRANWNNKTPGGRKSAQIFDATAPVGVQKCANNIQSILMPPFNNFAKLKAGVEVEKLASKQQLDEINKQLEKITDKVFYYLNKSNFNMVVTEALENMLISTGIMRINQISDEMPLNFTAISLDKVCIEGGINGDIENYWQRLTLPARQIPRYWPDAKLTDAIKHNLKNAPDTPIDLIEGTIFYPENKENKQWYYYVSLEHDQTDIVERYMGYNPWIGFRMNKSSDEVYGRGPILLLLSFIKDANKIAEFEMKANKMIAFPSYMVSDTGFMNPYNITIEPGAIVPIKNGPNGPPIVPLQANGNTQFLQLNLNDLRQLIRDGLFSDPLGPIDGQVKSKVEISLRQQNWLRQNAVSIGRLTNELLAPVIEKSVYILGQRGLIDIPKIDNKLITVEYESPLTDIQQKEDLDSLQEYLTFMQQVVGPQGALLSVNIENLPEYVAAKLNVDKSLIPNSAQLATMIQTLSSAASQDGVNNESIN